MEALNRNSEWNLFLGHWTQAQTAAVNCFPLLNVEAAALHSQTQLWTHCHKTQAGWGEGNGLFPACRSNLLCKPPCFIAWITNVLAVLKPRNYDFWALWGAVHFGVLLAVFCFCLGLERRQLRLMHGKCLGEKRSISLTSLLRGSIKSVRMGLRGKKQSKKTDCPEIFPAHEHTETTHRLQWSGGNNAILLERYNLTYLDTSFCTAKALAVWLSIQLPHLLQLPFLWRGDDKPHFTEMLTYSAPWNLGSHVSGGVISALWTWAIPAAGQSDAHHHHSPHELLFRR